MSKYESYDARPRLKTRSVQLLFGVLLPSAAQAKPLILICEDDKRQRLQLSVRFRKEGFAVKVFPCTDSAFRYLEKQRTAQLRLPDIILTDRRLVGATYGDLFALNLRKENFRMPVFLHTMDDEFVGNRFQIASDELLEFRSKYDLDRTVREIKACIEDRFTR